MKTVVIRSSIHLIEINTFIARMRHLSLPRITVIHPQDITHKDLVDVDKDEDLTILLQYSLTLVNVVEPEAMRICRILLWNRVRLSSSTLRKHCAVLSFVTSFCRFHTPSLCVNSSLGQRHFGSIRHSNPDILNSRLGLSLL